MRELLVNRCRHFVFTTALPPLLGTWWLDALQRVQSDELGRRSLHQSASVFRAELARHGVTALGKDYVLPIVLVEERRTVRTAQRLRLAGWDIRAIRTPSVPPGSARLRISIHADHDPGMLLAAAADVARAVAEYVE
jgi:8-amino-7-oxononanoate synthase